MQRAPGAFSLYYYFLRNVTSIGRFKKYTIMSQTYSVTALLENIMIFYMPALLVNNNCDMLKF